MKKRALQLDRVSNESSDRHFADIILFIFLLSQSAFKVLFELSACQVLDLLFAVNIPATLPDWISVKNFIKSFITSFLPIGYQQVRIAFVTYDYYQAYVQFGLSQNDSEDEVKLAIDRILFVPASFANPVWAMQAARQTIFRGTARPGVQQVLVLIMLNSPPSISNAEQEAGLLASANIRTITVDVGGVVGMTYLQLLASQSSDVIASANYTVLSTQAQTLSDVMCKPVPKQGMSSDSLSSDEGCSNFLSEECLLQEL